MVHQCRVTLVTVIVLALVTGSNSNFSFSNLISNYLTKYPSNVHGRHQKQFNQKPPLPPSHHQQSKNSRQTLSEVSRAFQLSSSLEKRNLNNKDVIKSVAQRNPIQQPVRIKLPDIINRQQNVNIRPAKNPNPKHPLSRNLQPSSTPPNFENRLKDVKQTGEIRMRLPPKFNSLFQTNEQRSGAKTATAILQRNLINSTMSHNQNSPPLFTDDSPVMQDFRFQGKDKPIFITQQNSGMTQNQRNIGPLAKSNQINKFPADALFYNRKNSSTQSSRIAKFPRTHIMAEEKKNKESLRPLLSSTENFFKEISTLRSTPRFDEFLSSKNFDDFIPGPNNYYNNNNNNRDRDRLKSPSTKATTFSRIPTSTTSSSKSTSPPPYKFFPPIYADSMLERFSDYKSPSKKRVTTKAATTTATPFRRDQPQTTSLYQNLGRESFTQYSPEIRYSEPLSYPNPLDTSFRQDDVELFDPLSYHNFAFSKTLKSDGYSKGNKKKDFTSPSVPQVGENLNLPEDNFIQGQAIQSRFSQKNEHRFLSSDEADNDIQTNYWSQNSAINNIKSYEKPRKTEAINSLSLESTDIFQNSNNNNYNENDGTLSRQLPRKMSTPVAKSGWTVLDDVEDEKAEYGGDYGAYDDYDWSSYEYDYKYATRRSSQDETSDSTFSDLHFNILSSPADIPKIGISTDFKPIEVIYNEMFEGPPNVQKPIKQARSFDFVAAASDNMKSTYLPFLPTPQPGMVHLRSYDKQNSKQQPQRKFSKRFLNIEPTEPKSIKSIEPNYLHGIHQTFLTNDFEIKKTRRKKKSFPTPEYAGPLVSSESILHAIVQSELMEN